MKILRLDDSFNSGACQYQTKISDFYDRATVSACAADDIYDFTDLNTLTIYTGNNKCMVTEPNSITKPYEKRGDSLYINGTPYFIVHLSKDTMILDYCNDINIYSPGSIENKAKIGMKFTGVQ